MKNTKINKLLSCTVITEIDEGEAASKFQIEYLFNGEFCTQKIDCPRGVNPILNQIYLEIISNVIRNILEGE